MELKQLALRDLQKLRGRVASEIAKREQNTRKNLLKRIQAMAAEEGLSLQDVIRGTPNTEPRKPGKRRSPVVLKQTPVPAKYAHPADPSKRWSGRGRKPEWVVTLLAEGKTLQDLLI